MLSRRNQETHFTYKDTCRLKVKEWRKIQHNNTDQNKAGLAILFSDKVDFRGRKFIKEKEKHYIMIKEPILQEAITVLNVYMPNNRLSKQLRQNLILQREIDKSTIIIGDFNAPLLELD